MNTHEFSLEKHYMFFFAHARGTCTPGAIVEKPTKIEKDKVLFHFLVGYKSEGEWIKKEEILAVGDNTTGTVQVKGWSGKYQILNSTLFKKYLGEGLIQLKTFPQLIEALPDCDIYYDGKHFYSQGK
ncbi:hypothetical protein IT401_00210 [Candidatus Nomurabacteria bacterium]|nr:hypothetical protein [Candidatus Nomurabacteria bacterium]